MSQIIKVYNSTDNKYEELDSDIATETTLSSVNTTLTTGNISTRDHIRDQRAQGNCYAVTNYNSNNTDNAHSMSVFWNPSDSGVNCYVYNISMVVTTGSTSSQPINTKIDIATGLTEGTGATKYTPANLKAGNSDDPTSIYYDNTGSDGSTIVNSVPILSRLLKPNTADTNDTNLIDFQEDFIELKPGTGIRFWYSGNTDPINVMYTNGVRYIRTTEQL